MNKMKELFAMIEEMDRNLGIWGDIIGAICLVLLGIGLFVFVPLIAG